MCIRRAAASDMAHSIAGSSSASLIPQVVFTATHCLSVDPPPPCAHAQVIFYLQWPDHF